MKIWSVIKVPEPSKCNCPEYCYCPSIPEMEIVGSFANEKKARATLAQYNLSRNYMANYDYEVFESELEME